MIKRILENRLVEKIINIILNILIVLFTIFFIVTLFTTIQSKITKANYNNVFGYATFEVKTGSMEKAINAGDFVIVKITKDIKTNDIISYNLGKDVITHRVVEAYKNTYVTRGDANNAKDDPIDVDQVIGKVVVIIPHFGVIKNTLFNPYVLISLIITIILFNTFTKSSRRKDKKKKDVKKLEKATPLIEEPQLEVDKEPVLVVDENTNLEETVLFRKIEVNEQNQLQEIEVSETPEEPIIEDIDDNLEQTRMFRVISVDSTELENTLVDITVEEVKQPIQNTMIVEDIEEEDIEPIEKSLKEKAKITRNVNNDIELLVSLKTDEIIELMDVLNNNQLSIVKTSKYKRIYATVYAKGLYYNTFDTLDINYGGKNNLIRMKKVHEMFLKSIKDKDTDQRIFETFNNNFELISTLDNAFITIKEEKRKKEFFINELSKYNPDENLELLAKDVLAIKIKYNTLLNEYFNKVTPPTFELEIAELRTRRNKYITRLAHNITFSKVFSDYIIDKTYQEGIIAEDKLEIAITLLTKQLARDILCLNYNKEYIIYIPSSLYKKEKKIKRLFNLFNNEYAKKNIIAAIDLEDLVSNNKVIKDLTKDGYRFALMLEGIDNIYKKDRKDIYMCSYIFTNSKTKKILDKYITADYKGNVINEDIMNDIKGIQGD